MNLSFFEFSPLPISLKIRKAIKFLAIILILLLFLLELTLPYTFWRQPTSQSFTNGMVDGMVEIFPTYASKGESVADIKRNPVREAYLVGKVLGHSYQTYLLIFLGALASLHGINTANVRWFLGGAILWALCKYTMIFALLDFYCISLQSALDYFNHGWQSKLANEAPLEQEVALNPSKGEERRFGRRKDS